MEKPSLSDYFLPVLRAFSEKRELTRAEIVDFITSNYDLIQNDSPKRSFILINACIGYFLKSNVLTHIKEKVYGITDAGIKLLNENIEKIDVKFLRKRYPEFEEFISGRYSEKKDKSQNRDEVIIEEKLPEEIIDEAYETYKNNLALELLEKIKNSSWQFFEILVKDLLVAMGYGDPYDDARIISGSGDGGIDGIIKGDVLGLEIICIQAKKWEDNVGRPEIQKFTGSLESHRAKKGVFITTSAFTKEAKEYVKSIEKKISLIDGKRLAELMIDYDIGVGTEKTISLKKIDSDYFDGA